MWPTTCPVISSIALCVSCLPVKDSVFTVLAPCRAQHLQSVGLMFLWLQTLSPACRSTGRWRHSRPCYRPWWYVHSYPQPHLWVPSVSRHRFCSVASRGQVLSISATIKICVDLETWKRLAPTKIIYLEFSVRGENANPPVIIVGYNYVTVHVHGDPRGALKLAWRATSDPKSHLKLAVIWEHLRGNDKESFQNITNVINWFIFKHFLLTTRHWPVYTGCYCRLPQSAR